MKTIAIPTYLSIDLSFKAVGLGNRFLAALIDWAIKIAYIPVIAAVMDLSGSSVLVVLLVYSPVVFYSFLFEWLNKGQSIGKMITKSRVIGIEGNVPSVYQCATRWMFNAIDIWFGYLFVSINPVFAVIGVFGPLVGTLLIIFSKNHQRLGDMAAQTIVVSTKEEVVSISDTIYAYSHKRDNYQPMFPAIMKLSDKDITRIKLILERGTEHDHEIVGKLASHVKKVLKIESNMADVAFLRKLLEDYNYYARYQ